MRLSSLWRTLSACAVGAVIAGCSGASAPPLAPAPFAAKSITFRAKHAVGLGKVLSTKNGGQIFGFDIDRNGTDGVLATATDVETFDQGSAKITKSFPKKLPPGTSYKVVGIFTGDVALVTRYVVPKGKLYAKRFYDVMNPVTAQKFTGSWAPPIRDIDVLQAGVNQATSEAALFAIELKKQDRPDIVVSDIAKNTVGRVIHLDPNLFGGGNGPQFDQDTATNQGVIALSPDGGRVGGEAPINVLVDLKTGKETQFAGLNNGAFGSGYVNGLAVDSSTGIAATTTELNAQVEFYNLAAKTGIAAQLPCTGSTSQLNSGAGIANDPVNGLFLVTDPFYCSGSQGSALVVYDESGNNVETITGFKFAIGEPPPVIDPSTRTGWAFGPGFNQLQEFSY
ncbi:MAG TPA: hypothetical protein VGZ06_05465 [Candidatus Cybelea sp.]|jgi:hypothetical protein|nr:hypothetical protein [Candidatus Cybelea sp.]